MFAKSRNKEIERFCGSLKMTNRSSPDYLTSKGLRRLAAIPDSNQPVGNGARAPRRARYVRRDKY